MAFDLSKKLCDAPVGCALSRQDVVLDEASTIYIREQLARLLDKLAGAGPKNLFMLTLQLKLSSMVIVPHVQSDNS